MSPAAPHPLDVAAAGWRWLRRMRTALYLLGVLALATFVATLIPQEPNVPRTVAQWRDGTEGPGEVAASLFDALGLFDVFGTPWFALLVVLLFTSLTACLIPRYRALWRLWRWGQPPRSRHVAGQPHVAHLVTDLPPREVLENARRVLRRRRYRLRRDDLPDTVAPLRADARGVLVAAPADADDLWGGTVDGGLVRAPVRQLAAERGQVAREAGSLLFHTAFYLLLIGVVVGQLTAFVGQVGVVEGQGFTDTPVAYWTRDEGRLWSPSDHAGFELTLDRFEVEFLEDGLPDLFRSTVTVDDGERTLTDTVVVNDPLIVDGMKVSQLDWGYAPRVVMTVDGQPVHDAYVTLTATEQGFWRGAVKAPGAEPQLGLELWLFPDAREGPDGRPVPSGSPQADAPLLLFTAWRGDLGLDGPQRVDVLDTSAMEELTSGGLRPGFEIELTDGLEVAFPDLRRWVGFQVSRRPTDGVLLAAAAVLLIGLFPALYAHRRRVWVEAVPVRGTTAVTVGGHAFQRPQAFGDEFRAIVRAVAAATEARSVSVTDAEEHERSRPLAVGPGGPAAP